MELPNGYTRVEYIQSSGTQYINTGYSIGSTTRIVAKMGFTSSPSANVFLFGTSYYTGTASSRQNFGLAHRTTATGYAVYNGGQWSAFQSKGTLDTNVHTFELNRSTNKFYVDDTEYSLTANSISNIAATMLIFASRQSGSSSLTADYFSSARLYSFKIYNGDTLIRDFVPVQRDNDSVYGLYDEANDVFYVNSGTGSFTGGSPVFEIIANASPSNGGTVTGSGYYASGTTVTLTATAQGRYSFSNWSDGDTNSSRTITVTEDAIYTAIFTKPKVVIGDEYRIYGKHFRNLRYNSTFYSTVLSADINEDLMQRATSTIVCTDVVPLEEGDVIFIRDAKNNHVFDGVIKSVEGNVITANQMQALYGIDIYATPDDADTREIYSDSYNAFIMASSYITLLSRGFLTTTADVQTDRFDNLVRQGMSSVFCLFNFEIVPDDFPRCPFRTNAEVINGEQLLYDVFSQFGIIPHFEMKIDECDPNPYSSPTADTSKLFLMVADVGWLQQGVVYVAPYPTINVGNNAEFIRNIEVIAEAENVNTLIIYDSTGTTYRKMYSVTTDGEYTEATTVESIDARYIPVHRKYINSDETLTSIRDGELKKIQYNHKINFTFDLDNNFYDFSDLHLGEYINFYVGDRLYNSVLTAWSFHIEQGQTLKQINMVCGKVRNNLTSKLNMGKVK